MTPDATAGDGLREAMLGGLVRSGVWPLGLAERSADDLLALPTLRDVLAVAARDAEKVRAVRELHAPVVNWSERECEACSTVCGDDECLGIVPWPCPTIRALDPS